jgi:hypothetical protein
MKARSFATAVILSAILVAALAAGGCSGGTAPKPSASTMSMSSAATSTSMPMKKMPEKVVRMEAVVNNGVQVVKIDLTGEAYSPNLVIAKAGVPVDITFGKGAGCVKKLVFPAFSITADTTQGPHTYHLPALQPGSYKWHCGMDMKHGELRVQ